MQPSAIVLQALASYQFLVAALQAPELTARVKAQLLSAAVETGLFVVVLRFLEEQLAKDEAAWNLAKAASDAAQSREANFFVLERPLAAEPELAADTLGLALHRTLADLLSAADDFYIGANTDCDASEPGGAADSVDFIEVAKGLSDTPQALEQCSADTAKVLADSDTAQDATQIGLSRFLFDSVSTTDAHAWQRQTGAQLPSGAADGGFLVLQNYSSGAYFAADYVGQRFNF